MAILVNPDMSAFECQYFRAKNFFNSPAALSFTSVHTIQSLVCSRNGIWEWVNGQDRYLAGKHVTGWSFCFSCFFLPPSLSLACI